ncbi:hypothetical protein DPMN_037819 [Dreissena polymorpha]|uniref:Uncharacterized protein n=1 Tax=Dreissena polymorpha TaxID=45954 RepID=A0A9D4RPJ9_DREPO|nr:hypothetical protein DPMN_037819 [Dreissena polymorpha]
MEGLQFIGRNIFWNRNKVEFVCVYHHRGRSSETCVVSVAWPLLPWNKEDPTLEASIIEAKFAISS